MDNNDHFHFLWERFKYHPKTFGGGRGVGWGNYKGYLLYIFQLSWISIENWYMKCTIDVLKGMDVDQWKLSCIYDF